MKQEISKAKQIRTLKNQNEHLMGVCAKQRDAITALKQEVEAYRLTMDSYLAALAARYGEAEYEGDEIIGYRFECPVDDFKAALKQHQVKFRKDEGRAMYVIGVLAPDKS